MVGVRTIMVQLLPPEWAGVISLAYTLLDVGLDKPQEFIQIA